jgi:hypothetical protein
MPAPVHPATSLVTCRQVSWIISPVSTCDFAAATSLRYPSRLQVQSPLQQLAAADILRCIAAEVLVQLQVMPQIQRHVAWEDNLLGELQAGLQVVHRMRPSGRHADHLTCPLRHDEH